MTTVLTLPRLRSDQTAVLLHPAKRKEVNTGRRWGKTTTGGVAVANVLRQHGRVAWTVPTYKNSRPLWRWMKQHFGPLTVDKSFGISESERVMTSYRGGFFGVYSADNIDAMRGEWFHLVVNDEAARITEEARYDVIEPCVADSDGEIIDISTPHGRNWFFVEFQRGMADGVEIASFTAPTSANPMPQIQKAFARARQQLPDRTFRQEWLAEFVADGVFFINVRPCATAVPRPATPGYTHVIGADWARSAGGDYTVFLVIDAATRQMVAMQRFAGMDFQSQLARLKRLHRDYPGLIVAEYNAMGGPLVEALQAAGLPVYGFVTTAASKHEIMTALALAFEQGAIAVFDDPVLLAEMESYEQKQRAGLPAYSAPAGMHDDTVMALAMAWHGATVGLVEESYLVVNDDRVEISPY